MSDTKERAGAAGVVVAGVFFKIALYVCVVVSAFLDREVFFSVWA